MALYLQQHRSQYEAGASAVTVHSGCTWTAGANGAAATTGGAKRPSPDQVHALVASSEETSPSTPGWSIPDLALAMHRLGVPLTDRSGVGWAGVTAELGANRYTVVQGVSAVFDNSTCSGSFDGDHAIGIHPNRKTDAAGVLWRWIDDPVCKTGRWERDSVLRRYAEALAPSVRFGSFDHPVPSAAAPAPVPPPVALAYGGRRIAPVSKVVRVARGRSANVRTAPRTTAKIARLLASGTRFGAYQVTDRGQTLAGSSRWYGDRTGTRWVHSSSF